MKRKIIYTESPKGIGKAIREGEIIKDFLPPPEQLIRKQAKTKITITLNSRSVDFYKNYAAKNNLKYQNMINEILDAYAQKFRDRVVGV
ncbi:MAG: BrnA antitoxin family protein [Termitinemataceae bacterium]|nr:MAG: BrnA antitoxin family protein [Termitinemataceae bacterium]GMO40818.1 MAG: BrnA antitoxin family protein [Termitinemataceae bacterium]